MAVASAARGGAGAREGRTECVQVLLQHGANPNARNRDMRTPLHWAASNGTASSVRALVAAGADMMAKNADGDTPLEVANYWNNPESAPALRHLMGFGKRIGIKCEGFNMGVQEHYSVQRVGVSCLCGWCACVGVHANCVNARTLIWYIY